LGSLPLSGKAFSDSLQASFIKEPLSVLAKQGEISGFFTFYADISVTLWYNADTLQEVWLL
jgi:hypothetical protein